MIINDLEHYLNQAEAALLLIKKLARQQKQEAAIWNAGYLEEARIGSRSLLSSTLMISQLLKLTQHHQPCPN